MTRAASETPGPSAASQPVMDPAAARCALVRLLQHAHAGELAAALAYRGHAASVRDPWERRELKRIEDPGEVFRSLFYRRYGQPPPGLTPPARSSP